VGEEVARLAQRQHGVIARRQLLGLGLGQGAIEHRLATHRLQAIHRGVYALGHPLLTREATFMAAVLAVGEGATLSFTSAAAHQDLLSLRGPIHITTHRKLESTGALTIHQICLPPDEVEVVDAIPVTTVARTLFDLAAIVPSHTLRAAMRQAEHRRLGDRVGLTELLGRYPHHRGVRALRAVAGEGVETGVIRSELEARFLQFLVDSGLPRPQTNLPIHLGERFVEADCAWPNRRLIAELDGRRFHDTERAFERDRARDRALAVAGWRVVRVTWRQLHDRPEALARDLGALLA
jgi:hypothetical protein